MYTLRAVIKAKPFPSLPSLSTLSRPKSWAVCSAFGLILSCVSVEAQSGALSNLVATDMSPVFDTDVTTYSVPKPASCTVPITATVAHPTNKTKLYIGGTQVTSGSTLNTWVCDGNEEVNIVIYDNWTEIGRYTITAVDLLPGLPPPLPISGKLTDVTIAYPLTPAFDPNVTEYTISRPSDCSVPIAAIAENADESHFRMYVANTPVASGETVNAWVCDGNDTIDIFIYDDWNEVGHYSIAVVGDMPPPSPDPEDPPPPTPILEPTPTPEPVPTSPPIPSQVSPVNDRIMTIRFLEEATFGPTHASIAEVQSKGFNYWMAEQANLPPSPITDTHEVMQLQSEHFLNMYHGADQLRQRMEFALSQLLVISANKNIYGEELVPYVRLLSKHAFGNYRSLLRDITLSPTMGKYLDLANSMKSSDSTSPNENYARELMQLFTIGLVELNQDGSTKLNAQGQPIPTYDQHTLREIARALTGWTYPTRPGETPDGNNWEYFVGLMEPRPENHDTGTKTLLNGTVIPAGQTVTQDLDAVLDNLFQHPNLPPFLATRLIRSLVTSNPSPAYITRVADVFANNGQGVRGDLWAVLKAVLTDTEATHPPLAQSGHLKDLILHLTSLGRALGAQVTDPNQFLYILSDLGQGVLEPNTVFSFYSPLGRLPGHPNLFGPEFQIYSPGSAIERANFIYQILVGELQGAFHVDLAPFIAVADNPASLVEKVNQVLLQGRMSSEMKQILITAAEASDEPEQRAIGTLYLTAISSEFSVQH